MQSLDISRVLALPKLSYYTQLVEQELETVLASENPSIQMPLIRLAQTSGKRLRSSLVMAIAHSQGVKIDKTVVRSCSAVELVHLASLVHDDIIDKALTRRGKPTVNNREGDNLAIVIGDYLFGKAYEQAAAVGQETAGLIGASVTKLCDGQSREMADQHNLDRSIQSLQAAHYGKTASLFEAACKIGGLCAKLSKTQVNSFARYGQSFGMAFQLLDDLLDLLSAPELLGKPIGNDMTEGIYSQPIILSLQGPSGRRVKSLIKQSNAKSRSELLDILFQEGHIKTTLADIYTYNRQAEELLTNFKPNSVLNGLKNLPGAYLEWAVATLVIEPRRALVTNILNSSRLLEPLPVG